MPARRLPIGELPKLTEARFQSQVIQLAQTLGYRAYHTYDSRRSEAGFPDLVLIRRPRVIWAELKLDGKHPTPKQQAWIEDLQESGQEVYVWRPADMQRIADTLAAGEE